MKKKIIGAALLLIVIILVIASCSAVKSTERGVSVMFGEVRETKNIHAGLNFKVPFIEKIKKYSIEPSQYDMLIKPMENGALTKDNQTIGLTMKIVWKYDESKIIDIAKNYTEKKLVTILQTISEASAKNIIGTYDIFSLAEKQETLSREIKSRMEEITTENGYPIILVDVQTTNFDWSDDFDDQIKLTMNRAQEVKQSQQELEKTKIVTQKQVVEAEANKTASITNAEGKRLSAIAEAQGQRDAMIAKAEGTKQAAIAKAEGDLKVAQLLAQAKVVEGEAIKKYNESIKPNLDVELSLRNIDIEKTRVTRWNGQYVPNNTYGPIPVDTYGGISGK